MNADPSISWSSCTHAASAAHSDWSRSFCSNSRPSSEAFHTARTTSSHRRAPVIVHDKASGTFKLVARGGLATEIFWTTDGAGKILHPFFARVTDPNQPAPNGRLAVGLLARGQHSISNDAWRLGKVTSERAHGRYGAFCYSSDSQRAERGWFHE